MFKKKDPERVRLISGLTSAHTAVSSSPNQMASQVDTTGSIKHCHDNSHAREDREREKKVAKRRLYVVSAICLVFMIGEILGGYFAGSLAVMTDAAHLLVDFISFLISLLSLWLSSRPATHKLSYGWHRAEILGSLLSVFTIWLVTGVLVYLAVERLINNNYTIEGTIMLITSGCALLANIVMALILHQSGHGHSHGGLASHGHGHKKGSERHPASDHTHQGGDPADAEQNRAVDGGRVQQHNASVRAAFVHVLGDLLQSVSVFLSAIIIFFKPEYKMADPICTFLFSIFVLCTTFTILRDILLVLMNGTPAGMKYGEVRDGLLGVKGVKAVHNLHIWALTMNQTVLSAHVAIDETVDAQTVLREMTQACVSSFNFHSVTIQMERQADLKPGCTMCEDPKM
ncbi:proton-coupled zinc antiporter SLC30A8-like [Pseudoliparis swirei]|uniref:proton-coupled zinc antiporter SLC30A8-like n=1 Tax=Pseudoliparis swirei TaxID=2059687 RepID=UPI0024BDF30F|nr:proton-coupled zinc antiporter SLC30A8-like [Pseudoliparis swirei]